MNAAASTMRRAARLAPAAVLVLVAGCGGDPRRDAARQGMVATAHPLATRAAVEVLCDGGNAADAAVAAAFALAVVEPYSSGLGGGGFLVAHLADGTDLALDARETAPAAAHRDMFLRDGIADAGLSRDGALAVATPGLVRGLETFHRRCGRLPWARLVAPAAALARDGFPADSLLCARLRENATRLDDAARAVFLPRGAAPVAGDTLRQPDLARTLLAIRDRGADAFHTGDLAASIAGAVARAGGVLSADDLAGYRPVWREPLRGRYRDCEVVAMPPPSSGGVLLIAMLNLLEPYELGAMPRDGAALAHLLAEAMSFAFADRSRWLGDPDAVAIPVGWLTSRARADSLRTLIRSDAVVPWQSLGGAAVVAPGPDHTTHLSVVDAEGAAVAATLTINLGFGAGMMAPGTGVVLNDEMDDFAAAPGAPNAFGLPGGEANAVGAGRRPLSSMTPTILLRGGRVALVTGSPGGSRIITTTLQTVVNVVDFGMDAAGAVARPRLHQQWWPPVLYVEPGAVGAAALDTLAAIGHVLATVPALGNAQVVTVDPVSGVVRGASDPRGVGAAAGTSPPAPGAAR